MIADFVFNIGIQTTQGTFGTFLETVLEQADFKEVKEIISFYLNELDGFEGKYGNLNDKEISYYGIKR